MTSWNPCIALAVLLGACALAPLQARADDADRGGPDRGYSVTKLVADVAGRAAAVDANLVNPWGMAFFPNGAFWINDNATGLSTLYDGQGHVIPVVFRVPAPAGQTGASAPTGIIINQTTGFLVPGTTLPAAFVFATEDGTISAWAGGLSSNPLDAVLAIDHAAQGAVYKGLEFGETTAGAFIYATNFHAGSIEVFDTSFAQAGAKLRGSFSDPRIPPGYAPFGIRNILGNLFVTYARQDAAKHDDVAGPGHGYVDVFDTDGRLLQRFASGGALNSPWGIALAPAGFGALGNHVLIGNFGDGRINAYDLDGHDHAALGNAIGQPIVIGGLWGLSFGGAKAAGPRALYFTAGGHDEAHGLFGLILPLPKATDSPGEQ